MDIESIVIKSCPLNGQSNNEPTTAFYLSNRLFTMLKQLALSVFLRNIA